MDYGSEEKNLRFSVVHFVGDFMDKFYFHTQKLCVGYQGKPLLRDVEIGIEKGEIIVLIGPNGAGKSTLLKSIAGQLKLLGGAVCLEDMEIAGMPGKELSRRMSVFFTEKMQTELMTCEDVVATGRYPYTGYFGVLSQEDRASVAKAMELVHIEEIKYQDFTKISDGQRQRVMLARAICQETEIIVLDEPVSFLDIRHKLEFLSVILELRDKRGLTVIMSLHELELAKIISDKVLCLKGEYVERYGTPDEIFRQGFIERLFDISEENFQGNKKLFSYIKQIEK